MDDQKRNNSCSVDVGGSPPTLLSGRNVQTETIDLQGLFSENVTVSGSFDLTGIKTSTFGRLLQALPIPALLINRSYEILFVNQSFENMSGGTLKRKGDSFASLFPDASESAKAKGLIDEVFVTKKPRVDESALKVASNEIWVRMHLRTVRLGQERSILLLVEDLTHEKRQRIDNQRHQEELRKSNEQLKQEIARRILSEKTLRESEHNFRTLAESAPFGLSVLKTDMTFEYFNPKFTEIFGYTKEDIPDRNAWLLKVFPHPEYRKRVEPFLTVDMKEAAGSKQVAARIFTARCKDGTDKTISFKAVVLKNGKQIVTYQDVTVETKAQQEILRAKTAWERTFDAVPDLITILDDKHRVVRANKAMADRLGVAPKQMVGMRCFEGIHKTSAPPESCPHAQVLQDGKEHSAEIVEPRLGGVFHVTVSPLRDQFGRLVGAVHVAHDITQERKATEALQERERLYRALVENASDIIYQTDASGVFKMVNPVGLRITGYSENEVIGKHYLDVVHPNYRQEIAEFYKTQLLQRIPGTYYEYPIVTKNGEILWFGQSTQLVMDGDTIVGFQSIARDITQRREAEEKLRSANEMLEKLLATAATAIFTVDPEGNITGVNEEFCRLTGFEQHEVVGKHCSIFSPPPCGPDDILSESDRKNSVFKRECALKAKDGRKLTVLMNATLMKDDNGKTVGAIESFVDVTELIEARYAAEQSSRAKSDFLARMSHEIRTPMNAIIGMTELALGTHLTPEQRDYLTLVESAADSLLKVINDVLDFSKIEVGKLELFPEDFDLDDCVWDTLRVLGPEANRKGLELAYYVHSDVPRSLVGDAGRLRQILTNLVSNSIKFTRQGQIEVQVETDSRTDREVVLYFRVADTGIGIPLNKQATIFEAFEQVDGSITRASGGTGLGLAIARQLVEMMGGRIWLASRINQGTTFHFTVTCGLQRETTEQQLLRPEIDLAGIRALVVDDNDINRRMLRDVLNNWGVATVEVDSARAAIDAIEAANRDKKPFSLALIDYMMPEMDGIQLIERINQDHSLTMEKILLLTSGAGPVASRRAAHLGVSAFLLKPIKQSQLLSAMTAALRKESLVPPDAAASGVGPSVEPGRGLRVLLAEDNVINQRLVVRLLEKAGHSVIVTPNGRKALEALESGRFDLIIMDIQMPEMSGFEATRLIREKEKHTGEHIPIVALTAHAMKGDREKCLEAGMDAYLTKPVRREDLFETVSRFTTAPPYKPTPAPISNNQTDMSSLNREALMRRLGGDKGLLEELATLFVEDSANLIAQIREALREQNPERLEKAAHTLKGTLGSLSANAACDAAIKLHEMARRRDLTEAPIVFQELEKETESVRKELKSLVKS
jgi:PAS domain S-box-containing protein